MGLPPPRHCWSGLLAGTAIVTGVNVKRHVVEMSETRDGVRNAKMSIVEHASEYHGSQLLPGNA